MNSAELTRVLEAESQQLIGGLIQELRTNLGTSHYRRLTAEQLSQRAYAVYVHLGQWLVSKDESAIKESGEDLGKRRFAEGIPLGQVVLALILEEQHLWDYLSRFSQPVEDELRRTVTEFYQKTVYSTAHGYEAALAVSNRLSRRAVVEPQQPDLAASKASSKPEAAKEEHDVEVSRGGQVGEFGG